MMINAIEGIIKSVERTEQNIMKLAFSLNHENNERKYDVANNSETTDVKISSRDLTRRYKKQICNGVNFSLTTSTYIGDQPLRLDPYETKHIECRVSEIPDSGEGLYAKCDLQKDTIVAFYNGVRLPYEIRGRPPENWATSGYKIHVNADWVSGLRMDIPVEYIDLSVYCATLGHKMNHSFDANCFAWFVDHPRKG